MRRAAAGSLCVCLFALAAATTVQAAPGAGPSSSAAFSPLTPSEQQALGAGVMVSRPLRFEQGGGQYVGGVSYQVVDAVPEVVLAKLSDVSNWPDALPRTKSAKRVESGDGLSRVELVQGSALLDARYTVVLARDGSETIRFWLDPSRAHDISDVWGYFRVSAAPGGRALITVGVALDLGDGLARLLFEDKIARLLLRAPRQIRAFLEPHSLSLSQK